MGLKDSLAREAERLQGMVNDGRVLHPTYTEHVDRLLVVSSELSRLSWTDREWLLAADCAMCMNRLSREVRKASRRRFGY